VLRIPRAATGTIAALSLAGALYVGFNPVAGVPPLGNLLDPVRGIWSVARSAELPREQQVALEGLGARVEVRYDDRGVPHIFAASDLDAFRALGWVHARDRLFQMELTQRSVAGTLAEFVGARALPLDRAARQRGLAAAAEARWAALAPGDPSRRIITAYMEGVNDFVRAMRDEDVPAEYHLLGKRPRVFQPQDTYYLLGAMALTLSYQDEELTRGGVEELVGTAATEALFPVDAPIQEPIQPVAGRTGPRYAAVRFPAPRLPDAKAIAEARRFRDAADQLAGGGDPGAPDVALSLLGPSRALTRGDAVVGSNNWAVAPARSANGHALLSGDPHLQLTLPSIWYEVHVVVAGGIDMYGVSLPLSPIVPIGFNRDVAWTATNTTADVMDFYRETVDDTLAPARYRLDGAWKAITTTVEEYRGPRGALLATDTLRRTHRGPLTRTALGWLSMRWTSLEMSDEAGAFREAIRARSAEEWYRAMERYRAPAQNFLVADRGGHIGIRSTGRYPLRPGDGRGNHLFDGSTSASDWTGEWKVTEYPQAMDPAQGYLASDNQQPIDPAVQPRYLGWDWPTPWRAMRINQILRADAGMTPEKMRLAQTDPRSALTDLVVSAVRAAVTARATVDSTTAGTETRAAMAFLDAWDRKFDIESRGAVLYDALLAELTRRTWDEFVLPGENRRVATPNGMMLVRLFDDPQSAWWDDRGTPDTREDRDAILVASLREAWTATRMRLGNDPGAWRWGAQRVANIRHLLALPGFGREGIPMQSGPGTLSPSDGRGIHGASWRFVVELGDAIQASGTYPGGQSGNPVSSRYADRLPLWEKGELAPLRIPHTAAELTGSALASVLTFTPEP